MSVPLESNGKPVGMHPLTWAAFQAAGNDPSEIMQTLGYAPASAGTHGEVGIGPDGLPYGGCFDYHKGDDTQEEADEFIQRNGLHGIMVFQRDPGVCGWPADDAEHFHCIDAHVKQLPLTTRQAHEWFNGGNGLVGDEDNNHPPSQDAMNVCRPIFLGSNPI